MVLKNIEAALERLVEGTFSRAFKSELQPVELGRQLVRELDQNRKLDVNGRKIAPNSFTIQLSEPDFAQFSETQADLKVELISSVRDYARAEDLGFVGPVSLELEADEAVTVGLSRIYPVFDDSIAPGDLSHCKLEASGGVVYELQNRIMTIGRLNTCDVAIDDENMSRNHAELRPQGDTFELVDLGSTNGCRVNGSKIRTHSLKDGDELTFGSYSLWFKQGSVGTL